MTEDEIAQKAWAQFREDHDVDAFFKNVSSVGYALGFRLPYYKALVLHRTGRDKEAAEHIALAIRHFEEPEKTVHLIMQRWKCLSVQYTN